MTEPDIDADAPSPDIAFAALRSVATDGYADLLIIAASRTTAGLEVASARPSAPLASALRDVIHGYIGDWTDREPIPYGPATEVADGQIMWVPASEVSMLAIDGAEADLADLPTFDSSGGFLSRLRLSSIRAQTNDHGRALFYRALAPSQVLARSGKIPIVQRGDRLDLVSPNTLLIDRSVDAVVVAGVVLFEDRKRFERVFGFFAQLRARAAETFDDVMTNLNVANLDEMRAAATGQLQMLGKMASIARKLADYPTYRDAITMENLVDFVTQHPHTGVEVVGTGASAQFVFQADPRHRFKILKLLDDDYLQSLLTQLAYEANSKGMPLT